MGVPSVVEGDPASPVLLHVPHAGTVIPERVRAGLLPHDDELAAEVAALTDHRTDVIALAAAGAAARRPAVLVNRVSRFVVDVERFPDGREEMAVVGMGAVYTHDTRGRRLRSDDPAAAAELLAAYHAPWAAAVSDAVGRLLARTGRAVLLDVHSYPSRALPYERYRTGPRPAVCLGVDPVHTPAALVAAARRAFAGVGTVGVNSPFRGCYVPPAQHRRDLRVSSIMVEIRRDTYLVEPDGPSTPGLAVLGTALAELIDTVTDPSA